MDCPRCGRALGEEKWQACPGCGADLRGAAGGTTLAMPPVPPDPGPRQASPTGGVPRQGYRPPRDPRRADATAVLGQEPHPTPGGGYYGAQYYDPATAGTGFPRPYPGSGAVSYGSGYPAYGAANPETARRGSLPLGILAVLLGAAMAVSTFLSWVSFSSIGLNLTGWDAIDSGVGTSGGAGFEVLVTDQGIVFFTGFFSLLLGALILLCGIVMLVRRRGAGIASLLLSMTAASLAAVNIAMAYAGMQAAPGAGLWMFAGTSAASVVVAIAAVY